MKTYLVTVLVGNALNFRYFDSIWVRKENAEERVRQLRQEFLRAGIPTERDDVPIPPRWAVRITEASASDGRLADETPLEMPLEAK